ncbi:metallophosphoesterase family protein [Undibacterium sp. TJN25]|uniref:metallophosphoesterase family protein n=1 Tax=Undibacterium sp. TJN25 TaxID=3413056 RepID=UPI003BF1D603
MGDALAAKAKAKSAPAAKAAKSVILYAAGDIADCKNKAAAESMAAKTAALVTSGLAGLGKDANAAVLTLGNNTYPVGTPDEFNDCYDGTWGKFLARTLPSPGNHDYAMPLGQGYYNYFGQQAGAGRRGYYSKDIGSWHIISLNSNLKDEQFQAQLKWLQEDLKSTGRSCTLAFWHHPVYSSGGRGNNAVMQPVWKMLYEARADLVLAGHDNNYERFAPQDAAGQRDDKKGMREFVVGTGGARLTPILLTKPNSELRDNSSYGVLKLTLNEKSYDWEFLPIAGQHLNDKGSSNCH